ncbi:MAG: ATP-grasp domain-containing protein [Bacteroidetes bacterium]|nr:ATP-grasp domain-containing protein [Bacteroidota bacterium]
MDHPINVLITGAGAPGGPGILQALRSAANIKLLAADADPLAAGRFLGEPFIQIPPANDPSFVDAVLQQCIKHQIQIVFPLVTKELLPLAMAKEKFKVQGIQVLVSDSKPLEIANNKARLLEHIKQAGIPCPAFQVARSAEELKSACESLGYPQQPVVMKPASANGSRGIRILDNHKNRFELLFNEKPNGLFRRLEEILPLLNGNEIPELVVMEFLPGDEYSVDTLMKNGEVQLIIPRKRIKLSAGISIKGIIEKNEAVIEYCRCILSSLDLNGPIGIQVKADRTGAFKLLEINPRIQGTSVAALGAGVNLPLLAVQQAMGIPLPHPIHIKWGIGFVRYYEEGFFNSGELNK